MNTNLYSNEHKEYYNDTNNINDDNIPLLLELENKSGHLNKKRLITYNNINSNDQYQLKNNLIDNKIELCYICKRNKFRYKCPLCNIKTCCLDCVNKHKIENNCIGKKDINFNNNITTTNDIMKDVRYLTHMINNKNNISKKYFNLTENNSNILEKDCSNNENKLNDTTKIYNKDKKLKNLAKLSKKFRNINYKRCPINLSRFYENNSFCDSKNKKFYWSVKVYFIKNSNNENNKICSYMISEPFDDSIYSISQILDYLNNIEKNKINNYDILDIITQEHYLSKEFKVYTKISKIEYENEQLKKELNNNNNYNNLIDYYKFNNYYYFKQISINEMNKTLKDYLKDKELKDYLEIYVKFN